MRMRKRIATARRDSSDEDASSDQEGEGDGGGEGDTEDGCEEGIDGIGGVGAKAPKGSPATMERPAAIGKASSSKFPRVDQTNSVYWGGGRLYKAMGNMARAYPEYRTGTTSGFGYTDVASLNVAWAKACRVIVGDPRPVS